MKTKVSNRTLRKKLSECVEVNQALLQVILEAQNTEYWLQRAMEMVRTSHSSESLKMAALLLTLARIKIEEQNGKQQ